MIHAKRVYRKHLYFAFKDFMQGVDVNNSKNRYHFLKSFVRKYETDGVTYKKGDSCPCYFHSKGIEWSSEELTEAIDIFFYIFSKDPSAVDHIKNLISIGMQSSNNDEDCGKFCECLLYGDKICIKIAQVFNIEEPVRDDNRPPVFDDWIKAIRNAFGNSELKYYSNMLYLGKVIRNLNAHDWAQKIDRINWVLTIQFLLHSYIGLCLMLMKIKGNPVDTDLDFRNSQAEDVVICTNNSISLKIEDANLNDIYTDAAPACMRKVRLERCKKYNIVIDEYTQSHEIELIATANNVTININCDLNSCNVIYNSRTTTSVPHSEQANSNGNSPDYDKWSTMAEILNNIYSSGTLMRCCYPSFDKSTLLDILHGPDISCTGELHERTKIFGENLIALSKVFKDIIKSDDAYHTYMDRLGCIESKVAQLCHNTNILDMSDLAGVANLLHFVGTELYTKAHIKRLIYADTYTGAGNCNNANTNIFYFVGNIILAYADNTQIKNIGAAILHDLYKMLPARYRPNITKDFESALKSTETEWDLYHIKLNL